MDNFNYGENLRLIRLAKGISQEAMAFGLHISQATYSRIESQAILQDHRQLFEIAKVLNVQPFELMPKQEEVDTKAILFTRGSGLSTKAKEILNAPVGMIILLGSGAALVNAVYDAAKGLCLGFGTSHFTLVLVSWTAALSTIAYIYYWVKKLKRMD